MIVTTEEIVAKCILLLPNSLHIISKYLSSPAGRSRGWPWPSRHRHNFYSS